MRMWMIPPQFLCRQHLLGEHNECHMLVGSINKGISITGYVNKGLAEIHNLQARHDELAQEMERRGYIHKSPLPQFTVTILGKIDVKENIKELCSRCSKCKERIIHE